MTAKDQAQRGRWAWRKFFSVLFGDLLSFLRKIEEARNGADTHRREEERRGRQEGVGISGTSIAVSRSGAASAVDFVLEPVQVDRAIRPR